MPLARAAVLIGENNSGKSSVLDCISLTLGRRWGQRGTGFSGYDLTIDGDTAPDAGAETTAEAAGTDDSAADAEAPEASVELFFTERIAGEWPEEITSGLSWNHPDRAGDGPQFDYAAGHVQAEPAGEDARAGLGVP